MSAEIKRALEAIVLVADSPVSVEVLAVMTDTEPARAETLLSELAMEYAAQERGFQLVRVAGGWRYQTHPDQAPYVERFVLEGQSAKLSAAALETLAIIAYKQPISRAQVATIRGVSVDGVVRTLEQRGYIGEVAHDPGPGQAVLFGTTPAFLEKMGLDSLAQLPAIAEFVPGADVVEALEIGLRVDVDPEPPASSRPSSIVGLGEPGAHGDLDLRGSDLEPGPARYGEPDFAPERPAETLRDPEPGPDAGDRPEPDPLG